MKKDIKPSKNKTVSHAIASRIAALKAKSQRANEAALSTMDGKAAAVFDAAEELSDMAERIERRAIAEANAKANEPAILVVSDNATAQELADARRRQSVKRGENVFLPAWGAATLALPHAFLRSSLFSANRSIQAGNALLLTGGSPKLVENHEIATFNNLTLKLSGHELCQFDRQVYATCLDYYREIPLASESGEEQIQTSFYGFAKGMGSKYSKTLHKSLCASLMRLRSAGISMRFKSVDFEVSKLLFVKFDEDAVRASGGKGSDVLSLRVTVAVAELFGLNVWTAVEKIVVGYDSLKGWTANFYASHATPQWLPLATLYRMSGYGSTLADFKKRLFQALDQLSEPATPDSCRVSHYRITPDRTRIMVMRSSWPKQKIPPVPTT